MQLNGGPQPDDPANLSVSVDWKIIKEQSFNIGSIEQTGT